jgi:hypothetical protein
MASKDKALGRVSDWSTLAMMAGISVLPLLPGQTIDRSPTKAPQRVAEQPVATPASEAPPRVAAQAVAPAPAEPTDKVPASQPATPVTSPAAEPVEDVWTDAEQAAGLRECLRVLAPVAAEIELQEPIKRGQCGTPAPLLLRSIGSAAKVEFRPAPKLNCRLAAQMARWVEAVLQPAAREVLGSRVKRIVGASSYSCRNVYNKPDLPLSQHATGSAVDIAGFVTADGRTISVKKGWGPTERDIAEAQRKIAEAAKAGAKKRKDPKAAKEDAAASAEKTAEKRRDEAKVQKAGFKAGEPAQGAVVPAAVSVTAAKTAESAFLKRLHSGACTVFGTALGPEANEAHRDHFHFDVKERKGRGVCH